MHGLMRCKDSFNVEYWRSTEALAAPFSRFQACHSVFADDIPLELGEGAEQVVDELSARSGSVDAFA